MRDYTGTDRRQFMPPVFRCQAETIGHEQCWNVASRRNWFCGRHYGMMNAEERRVFMERKFPDAPPY